MKKIKRIFICLFMVFVFVVNVNAICDNEDLNEWATTVEVKYVPTIGEVKYEKVNANGTKEEVTNRFAYILTINNVREDITIKMKDGEGNVADATYYELPDGTKVYGVGCFTNIDEETYIINIYGKGTCNEELLKTMKYTVPRFNEYSYKEVCDGNDSEYCKTFTNSTKDMTYDEFKEVIDKEQKEKDRPEGFMGLLKEYGLFILIPLIVVSVYYITKIRKYRQEERDR